MTLAPDGTAYVGVLGGLVEFRDATAPPSFGPSRRSRTTEPAGGGAVRDD